MVLYAVIGECPSIGHPTQLPSSSHEPPLRSWRGGIIYIESNAESRGFFNLVFGEWEHIFIFDGSIDLLGGWVEIFEG